VRGFSQPLFSRFQAACKRTVVLSSRCDLITKALASLLSGFIEVLSTLTTRTAWAGKSENGLSGGGRQPCVL